MPDTEDKQKPGRLPKIFDRNPELKKKAEKYLDSVPPEKKEADYQKFKKFLAGEMTWAEIKGYPRSFLKELAQAAYVKYKTGDYQTAETLFKGLSIIDHNNWYYRAALGAVYQKQKLYEQAIDEYTMALTLNETEVSALTNRGECYLYLQNYPQALADFRAVVASDTAAKSPWSRRASLILQKLEKEGHGN